MPRQLLGFYYDEERNRYFPLSMKPKGEEPSRKRRRVEGGIPSFSALEKLRTSYGSATHRRRALQQNGLLMIVVHFSDIYASNLSLTCGGKAYPAVSSGHITSFCAVVSTNHNGPVMVGDSSGWLYSLPHNDDPSRVVNRQPELNIGSSVSAICAWGSRRTYFQGGGERGVLVPDIEMGNVLQMLPTGSAALTMKLDNHLVYAGLRQGFITRFDTRLSTKNCETLLNHTYKRSPNAITHLSLIHQNELLVSTVWGYLQTYDLRFLRRAKPVLQFFGHENTSTIKLGIAVDPAEDFVFAAGEDKRVRGWSLRTGQQIPSDPINSRAAASLWHEAPREQTRLFDVLFDEPVAAMQVTMGETGPCMWAASGGDLYRMPLGNIDVSA
ncbi:hypothetical protein FOMPIDRAFT_1031921 [Fomitopsis schrenkii]|uniref:WD40 repeat-like protein n=1 Tax=Fomitopsis schrenkii TaxID=2126942 RepID=S8DWJ0_FOMSC|nr:hypothetical protein FOMPIDRAFT_1031921 [Fomitopsis schrenkii]